MYVYLSRVTSDKLRLYILQEQSSEIAAAAG